MIADMSPVKCRKHGGTFIEVVMACVVLALVAVVGGSYEARSALTLAVHRSRCVALATANSRLEELRDTPFSQLTNMVAGGAAVWVRRNGAGWRVSTAAEHDDFAIGTSMEELRTSLVLTNWPTLGSSKVLQVTTLATYRKPDYVRLMTLVGP